MGNFIGNLMGGYAQGRDNRLERKQASSDREALMTVLKGGAKPAVPAVGGEPEKAKGDGSTSYSWKGNPVTVNSGGGAAETTDTKGKTLGQKIGGGIKSGLKHILGFKRGGIIAKSGLAYVHKGEAIVPESVRKSKERTTMRKSVRKSSR